MGIPIPTNLTAEQVEACERFSVLVWGKLLFDREPSHNGRHGYGCEYCHPILAEHEARQNVAPQPWELPQAA
jgi:hypothetical protein